MTDVKRSQVFFAILQGIEGAKPYVIVSNNNRNRNLKTYLGVRVTTTVKPAMRSIVVLPGKKECVSGRVLCDDITLLYEDELNRSVGYLSPATMRQVDSALAAALSL